LEGNRWLVAHAGSHVAENLAPDSIKKKMSVVALTLLLFVLEVSHRPHEKSQQCHGLEARVNREVGHDRG
jgi:hypothetical protein